ncbi:hypothetical protein SAMN05444354_12563 [Stigmatella aurantiaca]|uniref:Uncharacterized protein n=2 Tax=Stigmatella aurantiaca TaxID=41 RepID=A0A1H8C3F9_STIAU|nr:hypothetical protein SAMN05444354_12563 [Stigmatella aurantiaca]
MGRRQRAYGGGMHAPRASVFRSLARLAVGGATVGLLACGGSEPESFRRLLVESAQGPCSEGMDCEGSDEVRADGTFRVDRFNAPGGPVQEVLLPPHALEDVRETATDSGLLETLERGEQPCGTVTDASVWLTLELENRSYRAQIAGCDAPGVGKLTALLKRLRDTYMQ